MSDLAQGNRANLILGPGDTYRVSTDGVATVEGLYGAPTGTTTITAGFATFGPYGVPAKLRVTATSGVCAYRLLADAVVPAIVRDNKGKAVGLTDTATAAGVGAELANYVPGLKNFKYANTRQAVGAYLGALAGNQRGRLIVSMDSNGAGTGALDNGTVGARAYSWSAQIAQAIKGMGGNAYSNWLFAGGETGASLTTMAAYYTASVVTFGSTIVYDTTKPGPCGGNFQVPVDATNGIITITPGIAFDTVEFLGGIAPAFGSVVLKDQADATAGTISMVNGTNTVAQKSATFPAGSTACKITTTSATCRLLGFGFRNSAKPGLEVINMSQSGQTASYFALVNFADPNYMHHLASLGKLITASTKNLVIIGGGANDIAAAQTYDQVKASFRARINYIQSLGVSVDIWGLGYPPANASQYTPAERQALNECLRSVIVDEYDLPFIDPLLALPPHADMFAIGMGATDGKHLQASGQTLYTNLVMSAFKHAAGLQA